MAQTSQKSQKSSSGRTRSSSGGRPRSSSGGRTPSSPAKRSGSAAKSRSQRSSARSSSNGGPVASARKSVEGGAQSVVDGAQSAGRAVGSVASAAKVPAVAGGAALAGLVGGMAISRRGPRRMLGVPIPGTARPLVKINGRGSGTKQLLKTGQQMADLAIEVRQARRQLATERKRSPIEVVLDGLTARRSRDAAK